VKLSDFSFDLPEDRIAQWPLLERDASKLLLLSKGSRNGWEDRSFSELPQILRGDELVVVNNTRVIPARLFGKRRGIGSEPPGRNSKSKSEHLSAEIEVLLTRNLGADRWETLVRPGKKVRVGERLGFGDDELEAEVIARGELGLRELHFISDGDVREAIERLGHIPLPPYIRRADEPEDRTRYQTIFAKNGSAAAAPTAGLHFTPAILENLRQKGVEFCELTLDVGLGTFQPIHEEEIERHHIHKECYEIPQETAERITRAKQARRPILAVGTTVVRALEDSANKAAVTKDSPIIAGRAEAEIYIYPGHSFKVVDQMLTNFHLPRSSLFVLTSAFAGRELLLAAYEHALSSDYRFYSYGDCMLIR
jgi:S-adenosylmethionine:tRNA ribosyltransferase-isomerase